MESRVSINGFARFFGDSVESRKMFGGLPSAFCARNLMALKDDLLRQLDSLITEATRLDESFSMMDMGTTESDVPEHVRQAFAVSAKAAIARIAGIK